MKTILLVILIILPSYVFATSGACSYHGGVNCFSGASLTGKAICNDGWESSMSYYLMDECSNPTIFINKCPYPISSGCSDEKQLKYYESAINFANMYYPGSATEAQKKLENCKQEITDYLDKINKHNKCMIDEYGYDPVSSKIVPTKAETENKKIQDDALTQNQQTCFAKNALYRESNGTCFCRNGESFNKYGSCAQNCYLIYGENAQMKDDGQCGCKDGYYINEYHTCVYGTKPTIQLTETIKKYVDFGNKCISATIFSQAEQSACFKYEYKPDLYNVIIVDSLSATNSQVLNTLTSANKSFLITATASGSSSKIFSRTLKKGMSGDDVKQLQILLQKLNYLPSTLMPSNYFGETTKNALIKFQKDNKIQPAIGSFGLTTKEKLILLAK